MNINDIACSECGRDVEWPSVRWDNENGKVWFNCKCGSFEDSEKLIPIVKKWQNIKGDTEKLKDFIENILCEKYFEIDECKITLEQTEIIKQQKTEGKDYEELLQLAIPEILKKLLLPKNTCKNHWDSLNLHETFDRLDDETIELFMEIHTDNIDYKKVLSEFCDTAAFSLFGIVHCLEKLRDDHK